MKILPVTNDDLYRVLAGSTIVVGAKDGEKIALRLYTAEELLLLHEKLTKEAGQEPNMTQEQAENLTRSHDLFALLENLQNQNKRKLNWG